MPSLKDIRRRISSVKNTQKITRAMKMVAAARLRRASEQISAFRPYAQHTESTLKSLLAQLGNEESDDLAAIHPLLASSEGNRSLIVVFSSNRGLAGAFNANVQKAALKTWQAQKDEGMQVSFATLGRKAADYLRRRDADLNKACDTDIDADAERPMQAMSDYLTQAYATGELDRCVLIYNEFRSAISQKVVVQPLLPFDSSLLDNDAAESEDLAAALTGDALLEPSRNSLIQTLLPMHLEAQLQRAYLESTASEHGARMAAMDAATKNAADMIAKLTLQFNRARQAAITKELMEIIGGAEALKG